MSEELQVGPEKAGPDMGSYGQSMLFVEDFPARTYPWPGIVADWLEKDPGSGLNFIASLSSSDRDWWLSKTSPVYCRPIMGRILPLSSQDLQGYSLKFLTRAGKTVDLAAVFSTTFLGEFWTLNTSEFPSDADASSLWQVLEPEAPQKYYLSPKACSGILRRAEKRGKKLPTLLEHCLQMVAGSTDPLEMPMSSISASPLPLLSGQTITAVSEETGQTPLFPMSPEPSAAEESADGPMTWTGAEPLFPSAWPSEETTPLDPSTWQLP
jgi:hypothetical protein